MRATIRIHLDQTSGNGPVWWADSSDIPEMVTTASTLSELRECVREAIELHNEHFNQTVEYGDEILAGTPTYPTNKDGQSQKPKTTSGPDNQVQLVPPVAVLA